MSAILVTMVAQSAAADAEAYSPGTRLSRAGRSSWILVALGAALGAVGYWVAAPSLTDDAYISLSAARNLAEHGQWAIVTDLTANTSTSPLNVLLLGLIVWVTSFFGAPAPLFALFVANVLAGGIVGAACASISRSIGRGMWLGGIAVVLVMSNPFLLSSIGLEVLLIPAAVLTLTAAALRGSPVVFGIASGLAVLVRLDLVLFVLLLAAFAPTLYRRWPRALLAAAAVSLPWYVFSWIVLGSLVPDTLVLKEGQAIEGFNYFDGPSLYYDGDWWGTLASFGPAVVGLVVTIGWLAACLSRRARDRASWPLIGLGLGGVAYYLAYTVLDTVPYHWYYVTPMIAGGSAAIFLAGISPRPVAAVSLLLVIVGIAGSIAFDTVRPMPWASPPIFGNFASAADYQRVGEEIGEIVGDDAVKSPGEIGTLAYACECTIVDEFSDRGVIINERIIPRLEESGPVGDLLLRANYANLDYSRKPVVPVYRIEYRPGPSDGSPWTWTVDSAARGVAHFALVRN